MKLTNTQIDELCQHLVEKTRNVDVYAYILFDTLYNTGLRVNELLEYSRIEIIDTNTVQVTTQKFSNPRLIQISDLNPIYFAHLAADTLNSILRSYSYYSNKFVLFNSLFPRLSIKDKRVTTHLFRHNYVKKLHDNGLTIPEISSIIGEKEDKNTIGYIYSEISGN
jgi:site-specific recombinase XerD